MFVVSSTNNTCINWETLSIESEEYKGGKLSKEHLMIFLCANMEDKFEKPLLVFIYLLVLVFICIRQSKKT